MNFHQNLNLSWNTQDVLSSAVIASPVDEKLNSNLDHHQRTGRPPRHPRQQQFGPLRDSRGAELPSTEPRPRVPLNLPNYLPVSQGEIYEPASPLHIELPQLANAALSLAHERSVSQPYMTPSASASSPSASPIGIPVKQTAVVSVATTFYPGNPDVFPSPDTILSSDDGTLFYLNAQLLARAGFNIPSSIPPTQGFPANNLTPLPRSPFLPEGSVPKLPDSSITLSIIFHALYSLSSTPLSPTLAALSYAISRMPEYTLTPAEVVQPGTALYIDLMTRHAPVQALQLYAIAGQYQIEKLAVDVSSHLLGLNLSEITDEIATTMGSVYLKRLFFMHKGRIERLKTVLGKPPTFHPDKIAECDGEKQSAWRRKWALLITSLAWDARPDISPHAIKQHLRLTGDSILCKKCRASWMERVVEASTEWATVKFTI